VASKWRARRIIMGLLMLRVGGDGGSLAPSSSASESSPSEARWFMHCSMLRLEPAMHCRACPLGRRARNALGTATHYTRRNAATGTSTRQWPPCGRLAPSSSRENATHVQPAIVEGGCCMCVLPNVTFGTRWAR
jgi:hypothetical protein